MRNLIFFTLLFLFCMNVPSSANGLIDDQESSSSTQPAIVRSPSLWLRLPARWLQPRAHQHHHTRPPKHYHKHRHHHKRRHKHHRGRHNSPPRHHKQWPHPSPPPPPSHSHQNPPPQPEKDPQDCSTALIYVDGCVPDLISSYFGEKVRVDANCCHTIAALSGKCFDEAFAQFKTPGFIGRVKGFCAQLR